MGPRNPHGRNPYQFVVCIQCFFSTDGKGCLVERGACWDRGSRREPEGHEGFATGSHETVCLRDGLKSFTSIQSFHSDNREVGTITIPLFR